MTKRTLWIFALLISVFSKGTAFAENQPDVEGAKAAAVKWLSLIDKKKYDESWKGAAEFFRKSVPMQSWSTQVKMVRSQVGALESRTFESASYKTSLPGVPDGQYVVIRYKAKFKSKGDAIETVTPMMEKDGSWKVSGYFIQ